MSEEKIKTEDERGPLSPEELEQVTGGVTEEESKSSREERVKTPQ